MVLLEVSPPLLLRVDVGLVPLWLIANGVTQHFKKKKNMEIPFQKEKSIYKSIINKMYVYKVIKTFHIL